MYRFLHFVCIYSAETWNIEFYCRQREESCFTIPKRNENSTINDLIMNLNVHVIYIHVKYDLIKRSCDLLIRFRSELNVFD